jgi:hypothetical protein
MDFYGTKLATCSSDRTVKIFEIKGGQQTLVCELRGYVTCTVCCFITYITTVVYKMNLTYCINMQARGPSVAGRLVTSKIWQSASQLQLRSEGHHLERDQRNMGKTLRI